eukprot:SAG31_NODE_1713_length_7466_cov_4.386182_6_plen_48_part_00
MKVHVCAYGRTGTTVLNLVQVTERYFKKIRKYQPVEVDLGSYTAIIS